MTLPPELIGVGITGLIMLLIGVFIGKPIGKAEGRKEGAQEATTQIQKQSTEQVLERVTDATQARAAVERAPDDSLSDQARRDPNNRLGRV